MEVITQKPSKLYNLALSLIFSISVGNTVFANINNDYNHYKELLIAPKCFLENNKIIYQELAHDKQSNLVLFEVEQEYWWQNVDNVYINNKNNSCGKFINANLYWQDYLEQNQVNNSRSSFSELDYHYFLQNFSASDNGYSDYNSHGLMRSELVGFEQPELTEQKISKDKLLLESLYNQISLDRIKKSMEGFTSMYNRASFLEEGVNAANQLKAVMEKLRDENGYSEDELQVYLVPTSLFGYKQPSVIAKLSTPENSDNSALVIGSHMDTLAGRMPGADDDGSGSMVVLETAKVLLSAKPKLNKPVYFIWYAAEEMGLIGSKAVVNYAEQENFNLDSILQLDTIGKRSDEADNTMWFLTDYVNQEFTTYLSKLAETFVGVPVDYTECGYACSDHASWTKGGYVAASGAEASFDNINPYLHSAQDTMDKLSYDNLVNFTKLSLAYVVNKSTD